MIITKIFSFSSIFETNFNQTIIDSSSQKYHRCFEYDVHFSSISRFLIHAQKNCNKVYTCKHCEKIFTSNNKLYMHLRLHHFKFNKTSRQRFVERRDNHINSSISLFISSTTFKSMTTSAKLLYLFISLTKAQIVRSIEFSIDFSITSTNLVVSIAFKSSRHYKSTCMLFILKIYIFINDLFKMFAEISSRKNMNIIQEKSISSSSSEFRQTRIKSLCQQSFKDTIMFTKKQFRKKWNIIHKRMRSFMSDQIQIINYFKFVDQSNSTSIKSIKFNTFINCFNSTSRICFSINQIARILQIAIDAISSLKSRFKSKTSTTKSSRFFEQEYIVVADVDHIKKDIRVETSLTNARKYNSIKSSIKLFKSLKSFKKLKFSIFSSRLNSTSQIDFSVNQVAETSQYQHIEIDKVKLLKSFKSVKLLKSLKSTAIINSLSSTFWFSLSVNHDSLISSRIDFLRALINQMTYVSINSYLRRFRQQ